MHPALKVILIGCGVIVVVGIIAIALAGWYVKSHSGDWIAQGKAIRAEGASYGKTVSESQCLTETMTRYGANRGMMNGIRQRMWLSGCLEAASPDAEFCSAVPAEEQFGATVKWRVARCQDFGLQGDSTCPNILAEVQRYCVSPARTKKTNP